MKGKLNIQNLISIIQGENTREKRKEGLRKLRKTKAKNGKKNRRQKCTRGECQRKVTDTWCYSQQKEKMSLGQED